MSSHLIGTRIREARRKMGVTQRHLADLAGLSPSYLNLIEHNRRGIAGVRLQALARALNISPALLSEGPERALLAELQAIAGDGSADASGIEALVAQNPVWADRIAALSRQNRDLRESLAVLTDRLSNDPFLAETLHAVLSNVTAIRSTAGILSTVDDIEPDQQRRFVRSIHEESRRLSDAATALSTYLDQAVQGKAAAATPEEVVDRFLQKHGFAFAALDAGQSVDEVMHDAAELDSAPAQTLARALLERYASDASDLPLDAFYAAAQDCQFDPFALQRKFGGQMRQIFRRLAALRRDSLESPRLGLLIVNSAGQALWRQPLAEFALPRHGGACTLWPIYQAFSHPNHATLTALEMPDGTSVFALSLAEPVGPLKLGANVDYQAAMLLIPAESAQGLGSWLSEKPLHRSVGTTCAICPRKNCDSRSGVNFLARVTDAPR